MSEIVDILSQVNEIAHPEVTTSVKPTKELYGFVLFVALIIALFFVSKSRKFKF